MRVSLLIEFCEPVLAMSQSERGYILIAKRSKHAAQVVDGLIGWGNGMSSNKSGVTNHMEERGTNTVGLWPVMRYLNCGPDHAASISSSSSGISVVMIVRVFP